MQAGGDRGFNPYADVPRPIGWNTTISAPSMHAETLSYLMNKLQSAKKVLDIGTGSGFITAAMALATPKDCKVYAIDHIKEINDFAEKNIKKVCPNLWRKNKILLLTQDGRKGLSKYQGDEMQYDVIHVGGQLNEVEN
jgi:protein-L-isoaspartate(D-aspartate) O-methyltransferase